MIFSVSGCTSLLIATKEADEKSKTFSAPPDNKAGVYIYREYSLFEAGQTKLIKMDGRIVGATEPYVYYNISAPPGKRVFPTQSEFGENKIEIDTEGGKNYFIKNYIKIGIFNEGADLELTDENKAKEYIKKNCKLVLPIEEK